MRKNRIKLALSIISGRKIFLSETEAECLGISYEDGKNTDKLTLTAVNIISESLELLIDNVESLKRKNDPFYGQEGT